MSLEKALADLQSAIEANTLALTGKKSSSAKDDGDDKPARRSRADKDDGDEKPKRSSKKDDDDEKPARGRPSKDDKEVTIETVRGAFAKFLGPKDGEDYEKNADFVEAVLNELGAEVVKEIKPKDFAAALYWVERKSKGKKVDFDDRGEEAPATEEDKPKRRRSFDD